MAEERIKISEFEAADSVDGTEMLPILQDGTNKLASINQVTADETAARVAADENEATTREAADALLIPLDQIGTPGGVAALDGDGLLPSVQVPPIDAANIVLGPFDGSSILAGNVQDAFLEMDEGKVANVAFEAHEADTTFVHGIADTTLLATKAYVDAATPDASGVFFAPAGMIDATDVQAALVELDAEKITAADATALADDAVTTHNLATDVHGISDTSQLVVAEDLFAANVTFSGTAHITEGSVASAFDELDVIVFNDSDAVQAHINATTDVHGIADTSVLVVNDDLAGFTAHGEATTDIHGIADTALLATQADITAAIDALIDAAPGALDTLAELAAAINDDESFAATVTDALAGKASSDVATALANGLLSAADKTKLDGIETAATGDQTAAEILTAIKTVDGAASGLDADLLDGLQATAFSTPASTASAVAVHSADTTNVHGITDTSELLTWADLSGSYLSSAGGHLSGGISFGLHPPNSGAIQLSNNTDYIKWQNAADTDGTGRIHYSPEDRIILDGANGVQVVPNLQVGSGNPGTVQQFGVATPTTTDNTATTMLAASSAVAKPLVVQANTAQVANLIEVQTSAGVAVLVVGPAGAFTAPRPYAAKTSAYTLTTADDIISADAASAPFTLTLPTAVGNTGRAFNCKRINSGANAVTIGTTSSQTIDGATTFVLSAQWQSATVVSNGANWLVI